jgi:hypothetical protein
VSAAKPGEPRGAASTTGSGAGTGEGGTQQPQRGTGAAEQADVPAEGAGEPVPHTVVPLEAGSDAPGAVEVDPQSDGHGPSGGILDGGRAAVAAPVETADPAAGGDATGSDAVAGLNGATALGPAEPSDAERNALATQDFPPPEGAERAAPQDAPAPARQWPLISVLVLTGLGLLIVGVHPFEAAFRVGTIMVGGALVGGAVLRRVVPSVGMLAVRSRFTDMVTYGVLGVAMVLFALMIQPRPWLDIPILQDVVHSTVP